MGGSKITAIAVKLKDACSLEESTLKSRDLYLLTKVHLVKAIVFPVVMYGYDCWAIKRLNAKQLMLSNCGAEEDSFESSLDRKEIKPVHPKGNQF